VEESTWVIYGQSEAQALHIVAGFGSLCGSDWNPSNRSNQMTDEDGDGIYTKTYENVAAGTYELKVTTGSWGQSWGDPDTGANYVLKIDNSGTNVTVGFDTAQDCWIDTFDLSANTVLDYCPSHGIDIIYVFV
jgi:hypothetical protein